MLVIAEDGAFLVIGRYFPANPQPSSRYEHLKLDNKSLKSYDVLDTKALLLRKALIDKGLIKFRRLVLWPRLSEST